MKYILKIMTGICFLPFLILGGVIAVIKTLIVISFGIAWDRGNYWHGYLLGKVNDFLQWVKQ